MISAGDIRNGITFEMDGKAVGFHWMMREVLLIC